MEIKIEEKVLNEVKDEVNLFLWNNGYPVETMKETNILIERLKNAKITFN